MTVTNEEIKNELKKIIVDLSFREVKNEAQLLAIAVAITTIKREIENDYRN